MSRGGGGRVDRWPAAPYPDRIREVLDRAAQGAHQALLVQLDTPGGLDTSMRDIIQSFPNARAPVIVFVSPQGARGESAGAPITLASHAAAMAPGTSIGAATPIDLQGGDLAEKIIHDAVSCAESISEQRERERLSALDSGELLEATDQRWVLETLQGDSFKRGTAAWSRPNEHGTSRRSCCRSHPARVATSP